MWYLCGLGSNIEASRNLPAAVAILAQGLGSLWLSEVVATRPRGMVTRHDFLNALVVFESPLAPVPLKAYLNQVEEQLGRNRADPRSSQKDRPMDIDILEYGECCRFTGADITEPYFADLFRGRCRHQGLALVLGDTVLGQAPAAIHWDQGAGYEVIVHQGQQLCDHTVEAAFPG